MTRFADLRGPLALGVGVILLAIAVRWGWTAGADRALLFALAPSAAWLPLALALTFLGDATTRLLIAAAASLGLLAAHRPRQGLALLATVLGGAGLNSAVKGLVARSRPDLLPRLDIVDSFSFPSGHAANGAILWLSLALLAPPRFRFAALCLAGLLAIGIGLSRIALAVHWPSDVLAGWLLGTGWVLLWRPLLLRPPVDRR